MDKKNLQNSLLLIKELTFQNDQNEKKAAQLVLKNKQKDKLTAELVIANEELTFQNQEKEKRAAELIIANKELAFQNEQKDKRVAKLVIANEELSFQIKEKAKRAVELFDSNKEVYELENRVKERTANLESFSYSVSHNLRSPLRAINEYANMLEEDYGTTLDDEGKRLLAEIQGNAKKMGALIDDLLTFSRLGRKGLTKSSLNMNKLVETVLIQVKKSTAHNAEITSRKLLPAVADFNLMEQVITNLVSNAIKYSSKKEKSLIEIKSERKNGALVYSISDNGVGFDMRYGHKLFNVFQRLHSDEEFPGTGVGLAIVALIIRNHDGKVWAVGKEGQGAIFYFSLPDITTK